MKLVQFYLASLMILSFVTLSNAQKESPNIILIMADDLGWGDVGYNGSIYATPNLDEMASNGIQFNRFYSASAVCSPTRASVLTGRNPERLGIVHANEGRLEKSETTIAEVLKSNGYITGHFGKWHLGTMTTTIKDSNRGGPGSEAEFSVPWENGFDVAFSTEAKVPTYNPMKKENANNHPTSFDDPDYYGTAYWVPPTSGKGEGTRVPLSDNLQGDDSRVMMDRVLPFIDDAVSDDKPFLSVIWFHTPHKPVVLDEEMEAIYGTAWNAMTNAQRQYGSSITAMDVQIGRLRNHLKNLGIADNTMIWFTSDNGPETNTPNSAGPYRARKRSLYEGGVRVPGVLEWPSAVTSPKETDVPMVTSDYYPTILDLLDIINPSNKPLDGASMKDLIVGNMRERIEPIGFRFQGASSYVTDCYKLIKPTPSATPELYDLIDDPFETNNIASTNADLANNLAEELSTWESALDQDLAYSPGSNMSCASFFIPDPNKTYFIDNVAHNIRLRSDGESEDPFIGELTNTGVNAQWKFVDKGNGYWHIQRAAGGSSPRLRSDNTEFADMQATSNTGIYTYFEMPQSSTSGAYHIVLPDGPENHKRLQITNAGEFKMVSDDFTGMWTQFRFTEVSDITTTARATLYRHCGYNGDNVSLGVGEYPNMPSVGLLNNDMSSLRVPSGLQVTLFNKTNFGGSSIIFTSDDNCLINNSFNDLTSSFIIEPLGANTRSSDIALSVTPEFGQKSNLQWYFLQEESKKVKEYVIRYSTSEEVEMLDLEVIPAEAIDGVTKYEYLHHTPVVGVNYYQVIVQFEDGTANYQMTGELTFEEQLGAIQIAPNPTDGNLFINLEKHMETSVDYFISTINGNQLLTGTWNSDHGDIVELNLDKLQNGLYIIYMKPKGYRAVATKFVVSKDY